MSMLCNQNNDCWQVISDRWNMGFGARNDNFQRLWELQYIIYISLVPTFFRIGVYTEIYLLVQMFENQQKTTL